MSEKKNISRLSDHRLYKKRGIIATPLNDGLRDLLKLTSWTKERMPEYLWLGLIPIYYGRNEGLKKAGEILFKISEEIKSLPYPRLSMIFNLPDEDRESVYKIIVSIIDKKILSPLTILYRFSRYPLFNEYFNIPQCRFESRINMLSKAIKLYYPPQSNEATDLRFLALSFLLFGGKLHLNVGIATRAFEKYPYTDHDDEKMRMYRPMIRSLEGADLGEGNVEFNTNFWRDIGMVTSCNPMGIVFDENGDNYDKYISGFQKVLEYILYSNKENSLSEDRFNVIVGSINYALKIFIEINEKSLGNSILGRHGIRTIIEVYIMLKYLLKMESTRPNIWGEYKLYGISKYKLILLKARETNLDKAAHFKPPVADAIVNEIKWEEFIDVDLKYFDREGIREKSIAVGEKDLYDLFYDYDSNFSHGLWGAIRESTMLYCNNADHLYHSIPDIYSNQKLPDIKADSLKMLKKLLSLLSNIYEIPEALLKNMDDGK